jgi:hypothetical protein
MLPFAPTVSLLQVLLCLQKLLAGSVASNQEVIHIDAASSYNSAIVDQDEGALVRKELLPSLGLESCYHVITPFPWSMNQTIKARQIFKTLILWVCLVVLQTTPPILQAPKRRVFTFKAL